ncbi:hypothetical protein MO867_07635 [Microbulbifer sp. OS29]|uniref:Uncharacterized protein n=1 Tax=Microbulbifer okhotskensis TaxID=2926617 RepID=A0A9X2J5B7_9GAMM|nr:hypothetical protein [Microbulbifer okhotskensis]
MNGNKVKIGIHAPKSPRPSRRDLCAH